ALVAAGGATGIGSLRILQNNDVCKSFPTGAATLPAVTVAKSHGTDAYVLQASVALGSAASFYFANGNYILPLDLITFSGALQNNITMLKWTTENETNASHFVVERSIDGSSFTSIGNVKANGITERSNYSFPDAQVLSLNTDVVYYRLKMVDQNNEFKYSNVITITISDNNSIVTASPNPVTNIAQVRIRPDAGGSVKWTLTDNAGRTIMNNQVQVQKNSSNVFSINMENLAQGTYYLQLSGAGMDKKVKLQKL
ncbi:MAG TPA: T9SS type A sorting domain-containing protein, partial [Flavisolibacter sp.]